LNLPSYTLDISDGFEPGEKPVLWSRLYNFICGLTENDGTMPVPSVLSSILHLSLSVLYHTAAPGLLFIFQNFYNISLHSLYTHFFPSCTHSIHSLINHPSFLHPLQPHGKHSVVHRCAAFFSILAVLYKTKSGGSFVKESKAVSHSAVRSSLGVYVQ
jgi:hypothetical protein